jgi:hypothetical protein
MNSADNLAPRYCGLNYSNLIFICTWFGLFYKGALTLIFTTTAGGNQGAFSKPHDATYFFEP